ncbi:MAG: spore cortex biosynthesis protein YabQ [Clostridia bacterium]|nr:spore cortex biosynthesis protein YabQ [Clostridia bacterium]
MAASYPACSDDMWEISIGGQALTCLYSLVLGAVLCVFYDVFRAARKTGVNSFLSVFITDIIFWLVSTVIVFLFLISTTNGEIRGYVILFSILGFLIYRFTIGRVLFYALCRVLKLLSRVWRGFSRLLADFCLITEKGAGILFEGVKKTILFAVTKSKKLLKNIYDMLYTKRHKENLEYDADE